MVKKRGLGKSLDALLAYTNPDVDAKSNVQPITPDNLDTATAGHERLRELGVELIQRGKYQPRREMDPVALEELADSIRAQGVIQPIIVRPVGDKYEIIAGERRWRAAQLAGLTEVPVVIRDIPDEAAVAIALIENIQREDLNPIEEACALERLLQEFDMTHQQVAEAVGKSRTTVTNLLRLLALPAEVKRMLERGQIEMGHARTLITLPEHLQHEAAELIVARELSVRETENLIKQMQANNPAKAASKKPQDPDILRLQEMLSGQFRLKVAIQCNAKGKGKLVIHYKNMKELDRLLAQLEETH